jgi:ATP-dependent Clp protease ATP-binding subunit ClpX
MKRLRRLRCSFCGRDESEVSKLVAGPRVYICDACVAVAKRLMDDDTGGAPTRERAAPTRRGLLERARRLLRRRNRADEKLSQTKLSDALPSPTMLHAGR